MAGIHVTCTSGNEKFYTKLLGSARITPRVNHGELSTAIAHLIFKFILISTFILLECLKLKTH